MAITDADDGFNQNTHFEPQVALKLIWEPRPWLHVSWSGLRTGRLGGDDFGEAAESAIEWGGTHIEPVGIGGIPTYQNGVLVAADPSPRIDEVFAWEADVILSDPNLGRVWLAFGQVHIESAGASMYDRELTYWIAEGVLELGALFDPLDRFFLASRYSAIGTLDADEGYSIAAMAGVEELGFNTKRVDMLSSGIGVRLTKWLILKTEYTYVEVDTVRGVAASIRDLGEKRDYYGAELTLSF